MVAPDASGLGIYVWDLMDPENNEIGLLEYIQNFLRYDEVQDRDTWMITSRILWSRDGSKLFFSSSGPFFATVDLSTTPNSKPIEPINNK
jgi:hypothetical protein